MNVDIKKIIGTIIKIALVSLVVGYILTVIDIDPLGFIKFLSNTMRNAAELVGDAVEWAMPYMMLGAIIVVPFYLIKYGLELLKRRRGR
jgi:hypothetical protein